ncbi:MAG: YIP1 family protein [Candidatus Micrarchaeota archaeon]
MAGFFEKMGKCALAIDEKNFEWLLKDGFMSALGYFAVLFAFNCVMTFIMAVLQTGDLILAAVLMLMSALINLLVMAAFLPIISHLLMGLFGGKRPLTDTLQIYFYAYTPYLAISWLGNIGSIFALISFGSAFRGVREINKAGFWQTFAAVLVPALVFVVFIVYVYLSLRDMVS